MVVYTFNPSILKVEQEDYKFEANLDYTVNSYLKSK